MANSRVSSKGIQKTSSASQKNVKEQGKTRVEVVLNKLFGKYVNSVSSEKAITDFSPNNIRALIFSDKEFMVVYHKRKVIAEVFNYGQVMKNDIEAVVNRKDVKSIFSVLFDSRKMSHIEEIVFLSSYNDMLLSYDINNSEGLQAICENQKRLRGIYKVNDTDITIATIKNAIIDGKILSYFRGITDYLKGKKVNDLTHNCSKNKEWYLETNLVGQSYAMDAQDGLLGKHFNDIKEQAKDLLKKKEERARQEKEAKKAIKVKHEKVNAIAKMVIGMQNKMNNIYTSKNMLSQASFAFVIEKEFASEMLIQYLENKRTTVLEEYNEIDWALLKRLYEDCGLIEEYVFLKDEVLGKLVDPYLLMDRGEKKKGNGRDSVAKNGLNTIYSILYEALHIFSYLTYFAYLKYLVQPGSTEFVNEYLQSIGPEYKDRTIPYSKAVTRLLKEIIPVDKQKGIEYFSEIFVLEEKDEIFSTKLLYKYAMFMLNGLERPTAK